MTGVFGVGKKAASFGEKIKDTAEGWKIPYKKKWGYRMKYMTYYEQRNTITVGKYQQMRQNMMANEQQYQMERYTLRKLKFIGNESQTARADYSLCIKNEDEEKIFLEKRYIQNGMHFKSSLRISKGECEKILEGDLEWMKGHKRDLLADFYLQITLNHLSPGYLTEYERERIHCKKGNYMIFCRKINRAVGITNRLFEDPEIVIPCLDEGKVLVTYKRMVKLPMIYGRLFTGAEEQPEEMAFLPV